MSKRELGSKASVSVSYCWHATSNANTIQLRFYVTQSEGITIQIMAQADLTDDPQHFVEHHEILARGDIIGVVGYPGRTSM
jgi:lysyl-tRNA synthetase class 2